MSDNQELITGSGGKGKRAHVPVESNDTLKSTQTVKVLLAVGEGEIQSIDDILLNKVSISNYSATWDWRSGTTNQTTIPGFVNTEAPLSPFTATQIQQGTDLTYSISSTADAVRLTFSLDSLKQYLGNGDLVGYTVDLQVYTKTTAVATLVLAKSITKTGKASNPYTWDVEIARPTGYTPGTNWQVVLRRTTANDSSVKLNSVTRIAAITQLFYKNATYPGTALVSIILKDAEQFGGTVPDIMVKGKGKKVLIPSNYNPTTRVYTGTWDLSMAATKQFTDNIAWVIYDVLVDSSCLGISVTEVDKTSFYLLSQYADQTISDGYGNNIPRYSIGNQFYARENVPTFLQNLLSICNAILTENEFGQLAIAFDQPNMQPAKLVTNANVVAGVFNYTSNDLESRYSLVNVTYNNTLNFNETDTATWQDDTLITRYGLQTSDIVLPGCVYEAQAVRKARWAAYTNAYTTRILTFKVLFEGLNYKNGTIIKVMDSDNADVSQHGVITNTSVTTGVTTLNLDRSITLAAQTYTVSFYGTDGVTIYNKTVIQTNTTVNAITFTGTEVPFVGGVFMLSGTVVPQLYRVVGNKKDGDEYTITCVQYDSNKFTYIDQTVTLTAPTGDFVNVSSFTCPAVTNIAVEENYFTDGINSNIKLHVHWDWDTALTQKYKATYEASWRRDKQDLLYIRNIEGKSFDIDNAVPGTYDVSIWAFNPASGIKSAVGSYTYNYKTSAGSSTLAPPTNIRVTGTAGLTYSTPALSLSFDYPAANNNVTDKLLDYVVEFWNTAGTTRYLVKTVTPDASKNGIVNLTLMENIAAFGSATRQYQIKLYSRDLVGYVSVAASVTVNNPVPGTQSFTITAGVSSVYLKVDTAPELDFAGYQVWRGTTAAFVKDASTLVYDGMDTYIGLSVPSNQQYYYAIAAYDSFGKTGLNISSEQTSTPIVVDATTWTKTGMALSIGATNRLDWTAGTILKNATTSYTISAGNATWTTGTMYLYFNPTVSTTVLQTTTTLATAVATGNYPIATYTGGSAANIKGGDGSAFISGSQLIAGTVGASQLITGTAVITDAAQIGNVIQSDNYDWVAPGYSGWKLDKSGTLYAAGIDIRDSSGNAIFQSGTGFTWANVTGTNLPAQNADVTLNQLAGNGVNIANYRYCTFEEATLPPLTAPANSGTIVLDTAQKMFGTKSVKLTAVTLEAYTYLGANAGDYNITLAPNKKWIVSGYIFSTTAGTSCDIFLRTSAAGAHYAVSGVTVANAWTRISGVIDLTADASTSAIMRIDVNTAAGVVWFDGLMVEQQIGTLTTPSAFNVPPNFLEKFVGALDATKNAIYRQTTAPTGGTYTTGDLWFNTSTVTGNLSQWNGSAWAKVADITVDQLAGSGANVIAPRYCTFEEATLPPFSSSNANIVLSQDTSIKYFGTKSLKFVSGATANSFIHSTGFDVIIPPNKKWIFSYYVYSDTATAIAQFNVGGIFGGLYDGASLYPSVSNSAALTAATWTRLSGVLDLSASALTAFKVRFDNHALNKNFWIDGVMLEEQVGNATTPSAFQIPPNFRDTYTGALDANNTYVDANGAIQGVSANAGTVVNNALIKVGGTNLMRNSGQFDSLDSWANFGTGVASLDYVTLYAGYPTLKIVGGATTNSVIMRLKADTEYTISALVKGSAATTTAYDKSLHIQVWRDEDTVNVHQDVGLVSDTAITTTWKTIYQTFKTPTSAAACYCKFFFYNTTDFITGYTLNVATVKLEEGNKYSTWTPAIEEVQNSEIRFNPNLVRSVDTWTLSGITVEQNVYAANKQALVLVAGATTISATSETLALATSTDYVISFEAWTTAVGAIVYVDLFPDTLPEYTVTPTLVPTLYTFVFNSTDASMAACQLRFFCQAGQHASGDIRICDVKIERSSVRTPWLPHVLDQKWSNISGTGKPADNATVGATIGVNLGGQITSSNASTFIADAAIGSAQIGSISLVGANKFNVKTAASGERIEMNEQVIKVFDAAGVLRVKLGNLV